MACGGIYLGGCCDTVLVGNSRRVFVDMECFGYPPFATGQPPSAFPGDSIVNPAQIRYEIQTETRCNGGACFTDIRPVCPFSFFGRPAATLGDRTAYNAASAACGPFGAPINISGSSSATNWSYQSTSFCSSGGTMLSTINYTRSGPHTLQSYIDLAQSIYQQYDLATMGDKIVQVNFGCNGNPVVVETPGPSPLITALEAIGYQSPGGTVLNLRKGAFRFAGPYCIVRRNSPAGSGPLLTDPKYCTQFGAPLPTQLIILQAQGFNSMANLQAAPCPGDCNMAP